MRRALLVLLLLLAGCTDKASPSGTRLTYRVVDDSGAVTSQVTVLQGPYAARTVTLQGDRSQGGFLWDEHGTYTVGPDGAITQTAAIGPGFPGPASDLALVLPVALRQHLVTRTAPGSVGGRDCTTWLSELPLDGAPFSPATAADRTESCVASDGTLLAERWQVSGRVIRTRTLVSTGTPPTTLYAGKRPMPLPSSSAAAVVKPATAAELSKLLQIPLPSAPPGLHADRAAAVLDIDRAREGFSREAGVFTWIGAGHLAVLRVERDLTASGGRTVRGEPVQLGGLGAGHLEPVLAGLRVLVDGPRGLRLIATADLPEDQLLSWLRSLRF